MALVDNMKYHILQDVHAMMYKVSVMTLDFERDLWAVERETARATLLFTGCNFVHEVLLQLFFRFIQFDFRYLFMQFEKITIFVIRHFCEKCSIDTLSDIIMFVFCYLFYQVLPYLMSGCEISKNVTLIELNRK